MNRGVISWQWMSRWQFNEVALQGTLQVCVQDYACITRCPISTYISIYELVATVDHCQENDRVEYLIVAIVGPTLPKGMHSNVLPVDSANGVMEVPPISKLLGHLLPSLWHRWAIDDLLHKLRNNYLTGFHAR